MCICQTTDLRVMDSGLVPGAIPTNPTVYSFYSKEKVSQSLPQKHKRVMLDVVST
jgi:hypothetical protein